MCTSILLKSTKYPCYCLPQLWKFQFCRHCYWKSCHSMWFIWGQYDHCPPRRPNCLWDLDYSNGQWPLQLLLHSWFASLVICGARFAIRNWLFVICGHMRVMRCALAMMIWLHTQWAVELNMSSSSPPWLQPENSHFPSQLDFISFFNAIFDMNIFHTP